MPAISGQNAESKAACRQVTHSDIEKVLHRESQLWWLAVTIICLLALAIIALDFIGIRPPDSHRNPVATVMDSRVIRALLLLTALLICAYFREKTRELRRELKATQYELLQSAKLASIGQLAGGVAHEINNPLTVILGRAQLLQLDSHHPDTTRALQTIISETERIAGIVRGMLRFSRQSPAERHEPIRIEEVLQRTLDLVEHQARHHQALVKLETEPQVREVLGSPGQLQQVFTNIMINAFQAMPQGGSLRIHTRQEAEKVRISFRDTGNGIDGETLERIFDPFFTTRDDGTGLGLSVSYGIIRDHGGLIEVTSHPGAGTTFTITLPAA